MKAFFESLAMRELLFRELETWRGTPFKANCARKKVGADCVQFVHGVLWNLGAIDRVSFPAYATHGGGRAIRELILQSFRAVPKLKVIWEEGGGPKPGPLPGDVFIISTGKALHHVAMVGNPPALWHCWENSVTEGNIFDGTAERHTVAIFRPFIPA